MGKAKLKGSRRKKNVIHDGSIREMGDLLPLGSLCFAVELLLLSVYEGAEKGLGWAGLCRRFRVVFLSRPDADCLPA